MFLFHFLHLYVAMNVMTVTLLMVTTISLVQQLQPAGVAVISADLAVLLVEAGRVGEGGRNGVGVGGWDRVPRRRSQRSGVTLWNSEWGRAVVLIGDSGRSSS